MKRYAEMFDTSLVARKPVTGKTIKAARLSRGLSVADLAKLARVDPVTIYRIESHGAKPRAATLARLVRALAKVPKLPEL